MKDQLQQPARISETAAADHAYERVYSQEKLDGVRAVWTGQNLLTRNGNHLLSCEHIAEELRGRGITDALDGEIYVPGWTLGQISGAARSKSHRPDLQFHVFDIAGEGTFEQRLTRVRALTSMQSIKIVPTYAEAEKSPSKLFSEVMERKGEGIIIRDADSEYTPGYAPLAALKVKPDYVLELDDSSRWDLV